MVTLGEGVAPVVAASAADRKTEARMFTYVLKGMIIRKMAGYCLEGPCLYIVDR